MIKQSTWVCWLVLKVYLTTTTLSLLIYRYSKEDDNIVLVGLSFWECIKCHEWRFHST